MSVGPGELLVVDDATGTLKEMVRFLEKSGFDVRSITTAGDCIQELKDDHPDLLILQAHSIASGFLDRVSRLGLDTGILVLVEPGHIEEILPLLDSGVSDYLEFPVAETALLSHAVNRNIRHIKEHRRRKQTEQDLEKLNKTLVDNFRTLERDQQSGFRVQQSMMPESPLSIGNVTFNHKIIPSLILSGDFIDYIELSDHRLLFYMSDVSGHGASSAFVTVLLKSLSRRLPRESQEHDLSNPGLILKWFNQELLECELDHHVTMFIGMLDKQKKKLQYANAAQFPAAILSSPDDTRFLEIGGLPLGLYSNAEYDVYDVDLKEEFTIIVFSDGVFEIMSEQTLKAKEEYLLSLVKYGNRSIDTLSDHLGLNDLSNVPDDIALLTVTKAV